MLPAIAIVMALAGCGAGSGGPDDPAASASLRASLRPASLQPSRPAVGGSDEVTGTLGSDTVEGGCVYLEAADGVRYQVLYPDGWRVTPSPLELRNPAGEVVATGGDSVTVRGALAADMASICQVGPMFRASVVVSIDR